MSEKKENSEEEDVNKGIVVFKPKKGIAQRVYKKAVIELDGVKYETNFDCELKIELPAKRYEFFCCGIRFDNIKTLREGGTFILNKGETVTILFKPPRFKIFCT
ncbi:MAG: hypothetical protein LUH47_05840 [Clostridiales bacterium]|nr:hypothetical protein [Clostridiales bacterium]